MKNSCIFFFLFLYSLGVLPQIKKPIDPLIENPHTLNFCGHFDYEDSPVSNCTNLNHYIYDNNSKLIHSNEFEFLDRFGNIYCSNTISENINSRITNEITIGHFVVVYEDIPLNIQQIINNVFSDLNVFLKFNSNTCGNSVLKVKFLNWF